jgi:hypothetical protein
VAISKHKEFQGKICLFWLDKAKEHLGNSLIFFVNREHGDGLALMHLSFIRCLDAAGAVFKFRDSDALEYLNYMVEVMCLREELKEPCKKIVDLYSQVKSKQEIALEEDEIQKLKQGLELLNGEIRELTWRYGFIEDEMMLF